MPATQRTIPINLALQGGGAHGAFTWGVLDRLLEEPNLSVERVSGTSAGALNGAALASGYATGGAEGARRALQALWEGVAAAGLPFTLLMLPLHKPSLGIWDDAMPLVSPQMANPLGDAPLRSVLSAVIDFDALRSERAPDLYVNAVSVEGGFCRVFVPAELTADVLLASACAPFLFPPVQIGPESYWDGSYATNPSLWPLYQDHDDADILLVELTPLHRTETPTAPRDILNRINEIASIQGLVSELRDLATAQAGGRDIRLHVLSLPGEGSSAQMEPSTKRAVGRALFESLKQTGRQACDHWLARHGERLGASSSVDIERAYLSRYRQPGIGPGKR